MISIVGKYRPNTMLRRRKAKEEEKKITKKYSERRKKTVVCTIKIANQANNMPNLQIIHLGTQHAKKKKTRGKSRAREEKRSVAHMHASNE